ncbi:MAG: Mut7-C RNAse domain-containing protein [Gammaproteobacteria bacterium]
MKHCCRHSLQRFKHGAEFRFYGGLNDFLAPEQSHRALPYRFNGNPGIKDPIEVFGVPHTEVERILVNGESVGFRYKLQNGDRVEVYPVNEGMAGKSGCLLRESLSGKATFVVDVNLGKLARLLRLLGFDTLYENTFGDREIVDLATIQKRIILTRDRRLLHAKEIIYGYWVRSVEPKRQLAEVVGRYDLSERIEPFRRCSACNGVIERVEKRQVIHLLEPKTRKYYDIFYRCPNCGKVYWQGSHIDHIHERFKQFLQK